MSNSNDLPVLIPPTNIDKDSDFEESDKISDTNQSTLTDDFYDHCKAKPHLILQVEQDDLVRDLCLSKEQSEMMGFRLQQWNMIDPNTKVTAYRRRNERFTTYFTMTNGICFCNDIPGLFLEFGVEHDPNFWRLFIDSSINSLKAVVLHNGNKYPLVPVCNAVTLKEIYENMSKILDAVKYNTFQWSICCDLKVISILLGMQDGYTKFMCFLCLWVSRDDTQHYIIQRWPERKDFIPGISNIKYTPLVEPTKILLPPLHIKLGLMKNFVKVLDKQGTTFDYLRKLFPAISNAMLKEGIFVVPQIRKLMKNEIFESILQKKELATWTSFKAVVNGFLRNKKE